jgi:hypothetical protein
MAPARSRQTACAAALSIRPVAKFLPRLWGLGLMVVCPLTRYGDRHELKVLQHRRSRPIGGKLGGNTRSTIHKDGGNALYINNIVRQYTGLHNR